MLTQPIQITKHEWPEGTRPMVSISCITYNHVNFIRDALQGFLMQETSFPVEIVVHDDASTDGTEEIIKEFENNFPRLFKCFYQPENTYRKPELKHLRDPFMNARSGKYIALCEGDDYWTDPLKLQKQFDYLEQHQEFVMCYHAYKIRQGEIIQDKSLPRKGRDYKGDELIATPPGIATATKFFRNVLHLKNNTKAAFRGGDYYLNVFLGTFGHCKYLSSVGPSIRRLHSGGVWTSKSRMAKHYGLINTRMNVYNYFKDIQDERRMNISLRAIRAAIDQEMPYLDPTHTSFKANRSELSFTFKKFRFFFYYRPLLGTIKKMLLKLFRR